jgi:hypothetical protein
MSEWERMGTERYGPIRTYCSLIGNYWLLRGLLGIPLRTADIACRNGGFYWRDLDPQFANNSPALRFSSWGHISPSLLEPLFDL